MKKILLLILLVLPVSSQAYTYEQFNTAYTADYLATVDIKDDIDLLVAKSHLAATLDAYNTANLVSVKEIKLELFCGLSKAQMNLDVFHNIIRLYVARFPKVASDPFSVTAYYALKHEFDCNQK